MKLSRLLTDILFIFYQIAVLVYFTFAYDDFSKNGWSLTIWYWITGLNILQVVTVIVIVVLEIKHDLKKEI
jgi:hypothetical protein